MLWLTVNCLVAYRTIVIVFIFVFRFFELLRFWFSVQFILLLCLYRYLYILRSFALQLHTEFTYARCVRFDFWFTFNLFMFWVCVRYEFICIVLRFYICVHLFYSCRLRSRAFIWAYTYFLSFDFSCKLNLFSLVFLLSLRLCFACYF